MGVPSVQSIFLINVKLRKRSQCMNHTSSLWHKLRFTIINKRKTVEGAGLQKANASACFGNSCTDMCFHTQTILLCTY